MEKICSKCKCSKSTTEYYRRSDRKSGLLSKCKECYQKIYFESKNKEILEYDNNLLKSCSKCKSHKELHKFYDQKKGKYGKTSMCKECTNSRNKKNRIKNKQIYVLPEYKICKRCNLNKEAKEYNFDRQKKDGLEPICRSCKNIISKEYRIRNNEKLTEKYRNRYKNDIEFMLCQRIRNRIRSAVKRGCKKSKSLELLGCTIDHLKQHLESQFAPTMTWENYGVEWHIDHKIPCSSFDLTDQKQQKVCFHYTNLQPLFATTRIIDGVEYIGNLNKSDLIIYN